MIHVKPSPLKARVLQTLNTRHAVTVDAMANHLGEDRDKVEKTLGWLYKRGEVVMSKVGWLRRVNGQMPVVGALGEQESEVRNANWFP